ncbi:RNA pseudouridine synthase 4, mitochondrial isoform X1 [Aegilops tauschii subsp. strangulata]|uniref:Pseudouridine synthase RsuA/RluA-like domain-containing protein n=5 Tax=Triticinae TaxID=1648030 RepID=A0A453KG18_AEGTS|nr:RNA pseudouridine synthase 4, mitochondrial isoform X2 [Aegilops tauschii subsp. strangulata]XP_020201779.1 RNA pseudouridine synthase 4, mitochondrial isoform X2 [Aegilops tauschii subsp. strangulata]XP_040245713.1 RNA pseudouridine synthase 4, mitochondrial isoform X2 [Aegilops tauschii subsp. strangulata]XP_040245714.1 RNA pseudouridine synthase 4, mitochondrial isoform X1 [Aegilops tauschii subsp. strangulata]XP_044396549.1 RNA pseudouridine synthase 4, mitochondrial-like isoform X1 [Tri
MTTRMAALLLLRRLAAGGAVTRLQQPYAGLATAAARQDALDATGEESGRPDKGNKNRWMELPPFAPVDAAAAARAIFRGQGGDEIEGNSNSTAIRWVRRCCPHLPASLVQKLFRLRKVKKNAVTAETSSTDASAEQFRLRRVSAKDHLVPGDTLFLPVNIQESPVAEKARKFDNRNEIDFLRSLEIYKDKAIIVVNKPPGMPVQGGVGIKNSIDVLAPMFEENSSDAPRLVHRLDRDCSGVLVLGRTQLSASILHAIFREKTADALADGTQQVLQRKYVALVMGTPRHPKGLLSAPLAKVLLQDGKSERLTVRAGPNTTSVQDALTEYRVIESCPRGFTWLELFPLTGRKHQLRVHCAEVLGTPIVGDYKYGRQAHQDWTPLPVPQTVDEELLRKQRLPFGLVLGGGSVAEEQPQLHLHCKQMMLPDISAAVQGLQSEDAERDFSGLEKLSFVAPLPLHMRLSWEVLKSVDK